MSAYDLQFRGENSGRRVGARIQLEVADQRNDGICPRGRTLAGTERRVAAHRFNAFSFASLSGGPYGMGLKENNRAF
jgi:hypothetical protein